MDEQIKEVEKTTDPLDIPKSLRRRPVEAEKLLDEPIELEREFVTIEEEGGVEVEAKE